MSGEHWTSNEWATNTVAKIVTMGLALPEERQYKMWDFIADASVTGAFVF